MIFTLIENPERTSKIKFEFEYGVQTFTGVITNDEDGDHHRLFDQNGDEIFDGEVYDQFIKTYFDDWSGLEQGDFYDSENTRW